MAKDMTGFVVGELKVLRRHGVISGQHSWNCLCSCGKEVVVRGSSLRTGKTKSCGCQKGKPTHGMTGTSEYQAWVNMRSRCYDEKNTYYKDYGGRGIQVCPEWINSFSNFIAHVGLKPSPEYSLDRIDVNGDYSPGNVRWATGKQQVRNTRKRRTNKSGIPGVKVNSKGFLVSLQIQTDDFFEACCIRKSFENRYWQD